MAYCTASMTSLRVDIDEGRLGSGGAGPLKVKIGLAEIAFHRSRISGIGHQNQLRIGGRKLKSRAELLDIGEVYSRLARNHDLLPGFRRIRRSKGP